MGKSVILQCKVQGEQDVKIQWAKDGQEIASTEQSRESRFSIERKKSEAKENETIVSLEIMEASVEDKGNYEPLAVATEGQEEKQTVALTEEAIVASLAAQPDEADSKPKKRKKIVKKKKKKEEKKAVQKPELSSYLRSLIKKEGEAIDLQCRLEEEMEEGECEVKWFFNDEELQESDEFVMSFDGTYAKLFIASCEMEHMGTFKCVFSNEAGSDETAGKVTVKPDEEAAKKREEAKQAQQRKMSGMGGAGENGGGGFKMPKKSGARKPLEKKEEEAPAFAGMKLKKSERVQRKIEGPKMETVDLKHHEFEKLPLEESTELTTVSEVTPFVGVTDRDYSDDKNKDEKPKKKKKKKKSDAGVGDGDEEDEEQVGQIRSLYFVFAFFLRYSRRAILHRVRKIL